MKADRCRSCKAPIIWAVTKTGKRMPVDETPTKGGNIILGMRWQLPPIAHVQTEQQLALLRERGEVLYVSHFATCKQGKKWRKK